jgi:hypothetical protein
MSFNIGKGESKYVAVYNVTMRFAYSEKIAFAELVTSRKASVSESDSEGVNAKRIFTRIEGRFVGNALEPAKALKSGQLISITSGWIEKDAQRDSLYAVVSDFELALDETDEAQNI